MQVDAEDDSRGHERRSDAAARRRRPRQRRRARAASPRRPAARAASGADPRGAGDAAGRMQRQRGPGGAPPRAPVRRGLADHPALRHRRRALTARTQVKRKALTWTAAQLMATHASILRQGRARPLWFGHPWVYANARRARRGRRRSRATSCRCPITTAASSAAGFYNPRSQIPVRLCTRADEAGRRRVLPRAASPAPAPRARASACRPPPPPPTAWSTARATTCPAWWSTSTATPRSSRSPPWASSSRRAEIFDALEAELGVKTIFEIAPAVVRRAGRASPAGSRVARGEPRAPSVPVLEDGIALEVEPLAGQKTGMFIDQRETRARVGALAKRRARARLLRLRGRVLAGGRARRRRGGHRRRQLGPRRRPHHGPRRQERRRHRGGRGRRLPLPRDRHARAPTIWW